MVSYREQLFLRGLIQYMIVGGGEMKFGTFFRKMISKMVPPISPITYTSLGRLFKRKVGLDLDRSGDPIFKIRVPKQEVFPRTTMGVIIKYDS